MVFTNRTKRVISIKSNTYETPDTHKKEYSQEAVPLMSIRLGRDRRI